MKESTQVHDRDRSRAADFSSAENLVDRRSSKPLAVYTRFSIVFQPCRTRAEKEKVYSRQYSAPILKRKSSRFGLGQLLGSTPPNNSIPGRVALLMLALDVAVYPLCYSMFLHIYIYIYTHIHTYIYKHIPTYLPICVHAKRDNVRCGNLCGKFDGSLTSLLTNEFA